VTFSTVITLLNYFCVQDSKTTGAGEKFGDVIDRLSKIDSLSAIGINCVNPNDAESLLRQSKSAKPFVVYPGLEFMMSYLKTYVYLPTYLHRYLHYLLLYVKIYTYIFRRFEFTSEKPLASFVPCWVEAGAKVIGGCCNVSLAQIKDIRSAIDQITN